MVNGFHALNPPTHCCFCQDPFPIRENRIEAWRGANGKIYCSADCEQDDLESEPTRKRQ